MRATLVKLVERWMGLTALALCACHPPRAQHPPQEQVTEKPAQAARSTRESAPASDTFSPQPGAPEAWFSEACTHPDAGLVNVARRFGQYRVERGVLMKNDELVFEMRKQGLPYVWPTTLVLVTGEQQEAESKIERWLASLPPQTQRRCGVAEVPAGKDLMLTAVVVTDALADVRSVPRKARVGQWLPLDVQLNVPVHDVEVIALGPTGLPFPLPATLSESGRVKAQLPLQRPGRWLFQVLPTLELGPRPAAELEVFVDTPLPTSFESQEVPGEASLIPEPDAAPERALLAMLNEARRSEGLAPLELNEVLSLVARDHASAMRQRQQVSHDLGAGDPGIRVARLELSPGVVAENIARANSIRGAHRAIWQSPSHRRSLLHTEFTQVGLGVVQDANGEVWVCQLFVDRI